MLSDVRILAFNLVSNKGGVRSFPGVRDLECIFFSHSVPAEVYKLSDLHKLCKYLPMQGNSQFLLLSEQLNSRSSLDLFPSFLHCLVI
jgi:hypothetical protein